jgi:anti-sigma B factor antagonist
VAGESSVLEIRVERAGSTALVRVCGELDVSTTDELIAAAHAALAEPCEHLLLSCADLTFVDSAGLRALVEVRTAGAATGTRCQLVDRSAQLERLLEITGLSTAFV